MTDQPLTDEQLQQIRERTKVAGTLAGPFSCWLQLIDDVHALLAEAKRVRQQRDAFRDAATKEHDRAYVLEMQNAAMRKIMQAVATAECRRVRVHMDGAQHAEGIALVSTANDLEMLRFETLTLLKETKGNK